MGLRGSQRSRWPLPVEFQPKSTKERTHLDRQLCLCGKVETEKTKPKSDPDCPLSATVANPRPLRQPRLLLPPSEGAKVTCRSQNISQPQRSDIPRAGPDGRHMPARHVQRAGNRRGQTGPRIRTSPALHFSKATHPSGVFHVAIATISDNEDIKYVT